MRKENLQQLDNFYDTVGIEIRTTRRASELAYDCPPLDEAAAIERSAKATIDNFYHDTTHEGLSEREVLSDLADLKAEYWGMASRLPEPFGERDIGTLEGYFEVFSNRTESEVRASIRDQYPAGSIPVVMVDAVERYMDEFDIEAQVAARITNTLLKKQLPLLKGYTEALMDQGLQSHEDASRFAFRHFGATIVPSHIDNVRQHVDAGGSLQSQLNKSSFYPDASENDLTGISLRISQKDAKGLMAIHALERRAYGDEEIQLAAELMRTPDMQQSMILFHIALLQFSAQYLDDHPERLEHSMIPFGEIFVKNQTEDGQSELLPNPRLMRLFSNNIAPAVAGVMLQEDTSVADLKPSQIGRGVQNAKRRRVFQAHIGKFNNYDPLTDTVEINDILGRTCPAMQMFSETLTEWLPKIYSDVKQSV